MDKELENMRAPATIEDKGAIECQPEISRFFGIIIRMFFDEHNPPHIHAEYQGQKAVFDLNGNVARGNLGSRTATRLAREWIESHVTELQADWELAQAGMEIKRIAPLE